MEQYFAVVYSDDGWIHLKAGDSKEDCFERLKDMKTYPKVLKHMRATTIIKRDMSNFKDGFIFGNPKSLDVMQIKEKK